MQIDDGPGGLRGRDAEQRNQHGGKSSKRHRWFALRRTGDDGPAEKGRRTQARKAPRVDEQGTEGSTSTYCRYCGCDDDADCATEMRDKAHIQVVVACGSCGHAFTALSRN